MIDYSDKSAKAIHAESECEKSTFILSGFRKKVFEFVCNRKFHVFIIGLIIFNAITLGLETSQSITNQLGPSLHILDQVILGVFVIEILLKLYAYRVRFFNDPWNVFDFLIIAISLMPTSGIFSILRALRILRVLRLLSVVRSMRAVIQALFNALPGMSSIILVLLLVFYVSSVMATKLFNHAFPEMFGTIGESMFTLFQVMTLEGWAAEVVRPIMVVYPYAWMFFIPFIVLTSFAVLNLFIGIIVNSLHIIEAAQNKEYMEDLEEQAHSEREEVIKEIQALRKELKSLNQKIDANK